MSFGQRHWRIIQRHDGKNQSHKHEQGNSDDFQHAPRPMVSDGKLCIDAGQLLRQLVRFLFAFRLGAQKLAYSRFKNDSKLYQLLSIGNRLAFLPF